MKPHELTGEEYDTLPEEGKKIYNRAILLIEEEHAGGPGGGWYDGQVLLQEIGWTLEKWSDGCRTFRTLCKPEFLINNK